MKNSRAKEKPWLIRAGLLLIILLASNHGTAQGSSYVLYLNEYLVGDFYYALLPDLDQADPPFITPERLRLPSWFKNNFEIANADVAPNGKTIIFAASRNTTGYDWNIYEGRINIKRSKIHRLSLLIANTGTRDEDPRYSWDGEYVVYKCDGNLCLYPEYQSNPVVESECELWGPSFHPSGDMVSYTKRCDGGNSDRIFVYDLLSEEEIPIPNYDGGPDRFSHFLNDGRLVYSHIDKKTWTSNLWVYDDGDVSLFHDRTQSDDDAYADKHNWSYTAFIGWQNGGYDLFVHRSVYQDSVQLTEGIPALGPVLFSR